MDPYDELPLLEEKCVRLLRVEKPPETSDPVQCRLETFALADNPTFTALSYTWGPPVHPVESEKEEVITSGHDTLQSRNSANHRERHGFQIICNGKQFNVTKNLHDFLRFRSESSDFDKLFWIDAISINQNDVAERGKQVNVMAEIYQAASSVVIWLGQEDEWTASAFGLVRVLATLTAQQQRGIHSRDVAATSTDILHNIGHWRALHHLFQRRYFSRAWIVQEVVFAKDVTIICGSHSLPWQNMTVVSDFLATSNWKHFLNSLEVSGSHHNRNEAFPGHSVPTRLAATKRTWASSSVDSLLYALIRSRPLLCQDPRDKVYSQLRLGNATIFPDYTISTEEVYISAAKYILERTDNLLLLAYVEGKEFQNVPGLPSWVPDWSVTKTLGLGVTGYKQFSAAGNLPRRYQLQGEATLVVEAAKLDDITEICETKEEIRQCARPLNLYRVLSTLEPTYFTEQSREELCWRTLMTNRSGAQPIRPIQYPAFAELEQSFHDWVLWRFAVAFQQMDQAHQSAFINSDPLVGLKSSNGILPSTAEILSNVQRVSRDATHMAHLQHNAAAYDLHFSHSMLLRPFRTAQGFFGLGSQSLRPGDSLWIVPGSRVPLIFRLGSTCSSRHQLVGGAYLHGFMLGQALNRNGLQFEMVELE
jgi:Heterokaryon incompatibility protein (HET)